MNLTGDTKLALCEPRAAVMAAGLSLGQALRSTSAVRTGTGCSFWALECTFRSVALKIRFLRSPGCDSDRIPAIVHFFPAQYLGFAAKDPWIDALAANQASRFFALFSPTAQARAAHSPLANPPFPSSHLTSASSSLSPLHSCRH